MERSGGCLRTATAPVAAVLLVVLPACGGDRLETARTRALHYFAGQVEHVDPGWSNLFGYMHRRFGLEAHDARGRALHAVPEDPSRPEVAAIYRRLVDPDAAVPAEAIADLPHVIDRITATALHCDRIGLPPDWPRILREASRKGGYALTHAALAGQWTLENGCLEWSELAGLQAEQVERLLELVEARRDLAERFRTPTDLWIEAMAMLHYLGAGTRLPEGALDDVLDAQRRDGGWASHPRARRSDPHASALALWVVLEELDPTAPRVVWIPQR